MCPTDPTNRAKFARLPQTTLDRAHEAAVLSERAQTTSEEIAGLGNAGRLSRVDALDRAKTLRSDATYLLDVADRLVATLEKVDADD